MQASAPRLHAIRYELGLLLVVVIWGVNFPIVKAILATVPPLLFNAWRFTLSTVFLGVLFFFERRRKGDSILSGLRWWHVVTLGLIGHVVYQAMFIIGIDLTTAGNSAFLISSAPLWTAVVSQAVRLERLSAGAWTGLALAFMGAAALVIARTGIDLESERLMGNLLSLGGAVAWGSFTALSKPVLRRTTPIALAFLSMLAALPFLWGLALAEGGPLVMTGDGYVWGGLIYSGIFSTGVAYVMWNVGIQHVGASHTAVYANLVPIVALMLGIGWLAEQVAPAEFGASAVILLGLFIMRTARRHR